MGRHSAGQPDETGVRPDGMGQLGQPVPPRNQQPMPPCTRCGAPFAAHLDGRCPQTEADTDRATARQSATGTQGTSQPSPSWASPSSGPAPVPQTAAPKPYRPKWPRRHPWLTGAAIVVALGISVYAIRASTAKTNAAKICITWESSPDGQVFDESKANGFCNTTRLTLSPQDGGVFNSDSGTPLHGNEVCSVPSVNGGLTASYGSVDFIYQGTTGNATEAENLCAAMMSAVNQGASSPADEASSPVDSTSTEAPAPVETETTPTAAATMSSTDYQALYQEAYQETATDYRDGQTPAIYHESDSEFCKATIETSLGNEDPIYTQAAWPH